MKYYFEFDSKKTDIEVLKNIIELIRKARLGKLNAVYCYEEKKK